MKTGLDKGGRAKAGPARVTPAAGISAARAAPVHPGVRASSAPKARAANDGQATPAVPGNSAPIVPRSRETPRVVRAVGSLAGSRKKAGRCPGEWEPRIRPGGG
ncbi:hypothetical protein [Amycolatopsis silviterrae]|uniref:Uncharacterized protein n=1 Tax=Amycolatopsis silviterrae TaxID=1656914 RepID=A0ABW5HDW1_9PSEU